eukprot:m51a1_g10399 putative alpha catalytic domain protein (1223) ;mRNA; f:69598-78383
MHTMKLSLAALAACLLGAAAAGAALPDISVAGVQAVKDWAKGRVQEAETSFQGRSRLASPSFWGSEIVYQIQVDRFNNGNLSNDRLNLPDTQAANQDTPNQYGLPDYRMGGDLRGITTRLDYLKDLGITSLWITPFLKHNGDYHGYCVTDYTEVDPGFGTADELRELVAQAHSRGIRIVMDVVFNHICDKNTKYSRQPDNHVDCTNTLDAAYWAGQPSGSPKQGDISCGPNTGAEMSGDESRVMFGDFTDLMFDLDTRNYDLQEIFTSLHKYWIAYADIDGFRLDAAKFTTADFIAYFSTQVRDYAKSIGKTNFLVLGEVAAPPDWIGRSLGKMMSNPSNPNDHGNVPAALTSRLNDLKSTYLAHPYSKYPGLDAVYNFALSGTLKDLLMNQRNAHALEDAFSAQYQQTLAAQNDARLDWVNVEIHDWPRIVEGGSDPTKSVLAVSALPLVQGTPVLYYGIEQGFNGNCHWDNMNLGAATQQVQSTCSANGDVVHRQDMFMGSGWRLGSTIAAIDKLAYVGKAEHALSPDWEKDPYLDRTHAVYKAARRINAIRQSCVALKSGSTASRWGDMNNAGILAFSRISGPMEIVVVVNTASSAAAIPKMQIDSGLNSVAGQKYKNMLNGLEVATTSVENGNSYLSFGMNIDGNSVKVFAHENNLGPWNTYLEAHLCKSAGGQSSDAASSAGGATASSSKVVPVPHSSAEAASSDHKDSASAAPGPDSDSCVDDSDVPVPASASNATPASNEATSDGVALPLQAVQLPRRMGDQARSWLLELPRALLVGDVLALLDPLSLARLSRCSRDLGDVVRCSRALWSSAVLRLPRTARAALSLAASALPVASLALVPGLVCGCGDPLSSAPAPYDASALLAACAPSLTWLDASRVRVSEQEVLQLACAPLLRRVALLVGPPDSFAPASLRSLALMRAPSSLTSLSVRVDAGGGDECDAGEFGVAVAEGLARAAVDAGADLAGVAEVDVDDWGAEAVAVLAACGRPSLLPSLRSLRLRLPRGGDGPGEREAAEWLRAHCPLLSTLSSGSPLTFSASLLARLPSVEHTCQCFPHADALAFPDGTAGLTTWETGNSPGQPSIRGMIDACSGLTALEITSEDGAINSAVVGALSALRELRSLSVEGFTLLGNLSGAVRSLQRSQARLRHLAMPSLAASLLSDSRAVSESVLMVSSQSDVVGTSSVSTEKTTMSPAMAATVARRGSLRPPRRSLFLS